MVRASKCSQRILVRLARIAKKHVLPLLYAGAVAEKFSALRYYLWFGLDWSWIGLVWIGLVWYYLLEYARVFSGIPEYI